MKKILTLFWLWLAALFLPKESEIYLNVSPVEEFWELIPRDYGDYSWSPWEMGEIVRADFARWYQLQEYQGNTTKAFQTEVLKRN